MSQAKLKDHPLLKSEEICFLATSDLQGNPHVKPIWFVFHEGKIWFETHQPTRAYKNIMENNKICLCFGGKETLIVWGRTIAYTEADAPLPFRQLLHEKYREAMDDTFIYEKTRIFEVVVQKERAWKYAPTWEDIKF